jgi:hypothetical protein
VRNVSGAIAAGEQPIVTDAVEALRQHMDEEAPDELVGRQRHRLMPARPLDPIVVCTENLNPDVMAMESAKDGEGFDASGPLNRANGWRVFVQ